MITHVTIDGETLYPIVGLLPRTPGQPLTTDPDQAYRWNGFLNPVFDRATFARICDDWNSTGDPEAGDPIMTLHPNGSVTIDVSAAYPGEGVDHFAAPTDGHYGMLTFGYTWMAAEPLYPADHPEALRLADQADGDPENGPRS